MAEENTNATMNTDDVSEVEAQGKQDDVQKDDNKLDEILERLAQAEAKASQAEVENEKLKRANDKLSKENAENKRQVRASMTADEQAKAELDEKIKALTERAEAAEAENNHNKAVAAYKEISDDKIVEQLIEAVSENDHVSIAKIIANERTKAVKDAQAEWMKSRPAVNNGTYSSMSMDEIMKIKDDEERQKAIAQNLASIT